MRLAFLITISVWVTAGCVSLRPGDEVVRESDATVACPDPGSRSEVVVGEEGEEELTGSVRWTCQNDYVLAGDVFVAREAELVIDPGVTIRARTNASLLVTRDGMIRAEGTVDRPIVFTSAQDAGSRERQDWRGIVLLGGARSNFPIDSVVHDTTVAGDARGYFSGGPDGPEAWDCGTLRYVQIEFAGGDFQPEWNPGAALTLAGCGPETTVDNVHVHEATDGLGLLGGSVDLRHIIVTGASDDGIEWAGGYRGRMQWVIVQSPPLSDAAIKGNNRQAEPVDAAPISFPWIYNATLVGRRGVIESNEETGFELEFASRGFLRNSIVLGFAGWGVDLTSRESAAGTAPNPEPPPERFVDVSATIFFGNESDFPGGGAEPPDDLDDDGGFDESAFFQDRPQNRYIDPVLTDPTSRTAPVFSSERNMIRAPSLAIPNDGFFMMAGYYGALRVEQTGAEEAWDRWATYPDG